MSNMSDAYRLLSNNQECFEYCRSVVPNWVSMDPHASTDGFLGVHDLYMYKMKQNSGNPKLRTVVA